MLENSPNPAAAQGVSSPTLTSRCSEKRQALPPHEQRRTEDLTMNHPYPADTRCWQSTEAENSPRKLLAAAASAAASLLLTLGLLAPSTARAVDGCLVLLCFAAPSWKSVPQRVPPIRKVLRDLARGKAFPSCGMSGPGNSARHVWARAPGNCPPQYTRVHESESGPIYTCDYTGAITVTM
jgi:hypothetical protein